MAVERERVGSRGWPSRAEDFIEKPSEKKWAFRESKPQLCHIPSTCEEGGGELKGVSMSARAALCTL